jgi:hypothetical protein
MSPVALRADEVRRLREYWRALPARDARRISAGSKLGDSLLALAALHREAALQIDARAASLPRPADARATQSGDHSDSGSEQPLPPFVLPRDQVSLAALDPRARMHVVAADERLLEAIDVLREVTASVRPEAAAAAHASIARALTELGQRIAARPEWASVVRLPMHAITASAHVEAWLAFAQWFDEDGRTLDLETALRNARVAAALIVDPGILRSACERQLAPTGRARGGATFCEAPAPPR